MSTPLFTPGPWRAIPCCDNQAHTAEEWGLRIDGPSRPVHPRGYVAADARLISAAPELFELVEWALSMGVIDNGGDWSISARAALAKARGET